MKHNHRYSSATERAAAILNEINLPSSINDIDHTRDTQSSITINYSKDSNGKRAKKDIKRQKKVKSDRVSPKRRNRCNSREDCMLDIVPITATERAAILLHSSQDVERGLIKSIAMQKKTKVVQRGSRTAENCRKTKNYVSDITPKTATERAAALLHSIEYANNYTMQVIEKSPTKEIEKQKKTKMDNVSRTTITNCRKRKERHVPNCVLDIVPITATERAAILLRSSQDVEKGSIRGIATQEKTKVVHRVLRAVENCRKTKNHVSDIMPKTATERAAALLHSTQHFTETREAATGDSIVQSTKYCINDKFSSKYSPEYSKRENLRGKFASRAKNDAKENPQSRSAHSKNTKGGGLGVTETATERALAILCRLDSNQLNNEPFFSHVIEERQEVHTDLFQNGTTDILIGKGTKIIASKLLEHSEEKEPKRLKNNILLQDSNVSLKLNTLIKLERENNVLHAVRDKLLKVLETLEAEVQNSLLTLNTNEHKSISDDCNMMSYSNDLEEMLLRSDSDYDS